MKALWWFAPLALVIVGAAVFSHSTGGSSAGQLTMSIDADPTNGTRPCAPIDAAATVPLNTTHTVAVCLSNYLTDFGTPNAFEARVEYSTLETAPEVADAGTALADNPDANDTAAPNGLGATGWDCTGFGLGLPKGDDPLTAERDAFITCYNSANTGVLASEPGLLATITLTSGAVAGQEALSFLSSTNIYSINCPTSVDLACVGATINIGAAGPTNTATPSATPTRTNTPLPTNTNTPVPPTNTPTRTNTPVAPTSTNTPTNTPVVVNTATNTATATNTPISTATPTPTAPPATGGPVIAPGTPVFTGGVHRLPILAASTATVAYQGFNLQIAMAASAGLNLTGTGSAGSPPNIENSILMVDSDADGTPDAGSLSCNGGFPPAGSGRVFGCTTLPIAQQPPAEPIPPFSTTSNGLLGTFSFTGTGDGCLQVRLVDLPANDPDAAIYDTFTLFIAGGSALSQNNTVDTTPVNILFGTGTLDQCPGAPTSTPTATNTSVPTNTSTNTPIATSTSTNTPVATDTATATATATSVIPVDTATATSTSVVPADTATATSTAVVPADTATATSTAVVPADTATATNTPVIVNTATATNTAVATSTPTNTAIATATSTPIASQTVEVTKTIQVTKTAEITKTVEVTRTVEVTKTVIGVTKTPDETTETPTATATPTEIVNTETATSTATATNVPSTSTPTSTATAIVTSTKTSVPTATKTVIRTSTPRATSTTGATSTSPAGTTTAVSTVLAAQTGPRGGAAGASALPNTGQGDARGGTGWTIAWLALIVGFAGSMGLIVMKRRRG